MAAKKKRPNRLFGAMEGLVLLESDYLAEIVD